MAGDEKPYRVYRGGRTKGKVPLSRNEREARRAAPRDALASPATGASPGSVDFGTGRILGPAQQSSSQDTATPTPTASVSAWSPTAALSVVLLAVGVLLFVLRLAAYRPR